MRHTNTKTLSWPCDGCQTRLTEGVDPFCILEMTEKDEAEGEIIRLCRECERTKLRKRE